jgi:hypothetical protein
MEYFKASWIHDLPDEPVLFYSELDSSRYETRKIELYRDERVGLADADFEFGGAVLGLVPVPSIEEINSDPEFVAQQISTEEFEEIWAKFIRLRH